MAKKPFVVLDAEILSSSVWAEAAHVRLVWITLLILCDTEGNVGASVPGIANAAGVSLQEAEAAMARLQEPDPYSRTTANEGRRLQPIERGWKVLNFIEHLDRLSSERKKARDRVWRSRQRAKERQETTSNDTPTTQGRQSSQGEEKREKGPKKERQRTAPAARDASPWPSSRAADIFLRHYPKGKPSPAMFSTLRPLVQQHSWEAVAPELEAYLQGTEVSYHSWPKFASGFGSWANGKPRKGDSAAIFTGNKAAALGFLKRVDDVIDGKAKA